MNPQTVQETRRVLSIIDDLIEDVGILGLLPPYFSALPQADMKRITGAFSDADAAKEVQSQLAEHFKAELRLEGAAGGVTKDDVADHRLGTRALVDTLRQAGYPHNATTYRSSELIDNFGEILTVMRTLLHGRLNTTVEDDVVKFVILNDTVNREKTASADVQALNREYQNEKESRRVEVEKRRQQIQRLRDEIDRLRQNTEIETSNFVKVAKEIADANDSKYAQKINDLHDEEDKTQADFKGVQRRNQDAEAALRQARTKKEKELSEVLRHYDQEMNSLTNDITRLTTELESDAQSVTEVDSKLQVLNGEAAAYDLERKNDDLRRQHCEDISAKMHHCARIVQGFIRAFADRQAHAQKGKKKKKGKKSK